MLRSIRRKVMQRRMDDLFMSTLITVADKASCSKKR